jgi:hypothetical protein
MNSSSLNQELSEFNLTQECSLEFLALFAHGVAFEYAIDFLCKSFSLTLEKKQENYIIASGNDFSIRLKLIPSSCSSYAESALVKVLTEIEYDLQNAKELLEEKTIGVIFADLIVMHDSVGERRTQEAYKLLNELENTLRKVVVVRAASLAGKEWWDNRIKNRLNDSRSESRRSSEINDIDITRRGDQEFHEIFYIDLSALKKTIEEPENWRDGFSKDLQSKRNLERLEFLNKLRRKIAHNRFLSQSNFDELRQIHAHLMYFCRRSLGEL